MKADRTRIIRARATAYGIKIKELARKTGIAESTLFRKLNNPDSITLGELRAIDRQIRLEDDELMALVRRVS